MAASCESPSLQGAVVCRDNIACDNNTRNSNIRKVMAAIFIAHKVPPQEFPEDKPLSDVEHYAQHSRSVLALVPTPSGKEINWGNKPVADTQAQAWAFHYYVSFITALARLRLPSSLPCTLASNMPIDTFCCSHACAVSRLLRHRCLIFSSTCIPALPHGQSLLPLVVKVLC